MITITGVIIKPINVVRKKVIKQKDYMKRILRSNGQPVI